MVIRKAVNAGSWYKGNKPDLIKSLNEYFTNKVFGPGEEPKTLNQDQRRIICGVSPHAGHRYSGCCAAYTYLNLFKEKIPDTIVILGTDHKRYPNIALMSEGEWETPLGNLKVDTELSKEILMNSDIIVEDESAFIELPYGGEHNIEIQLPFIKYCVKENDVKIVPIKFTTKNYNFDFETLDILTTDIVQAVKALDKDIIFVASSDLSHKHPRDLFNPKEDLEDMRKKDQLVIDAFVEFDPKKALKAAQNTSVCGPQTITALMLIGKKLNATSTQFLKYYTSYEKDQNGKGPCEISVGYFSGVVIK